MNEIESTKAWGELVLAACRTESPRLLRIGHAILRDLSMAEDVCQTAFMRAIERREEITEAAHLASWLTRVVINECALLLRRRRSERAAQQAWGEPADARASDRMEREGLSTELRERLAVELAELPERFRDVVVLRVLAGLAGNETAELLGCSPAEISRRLYSGMELLRDRLKDLVNSER